jgi:hypothetical protein
MNISSKCNCCCKENVCKYKEQYIADCKAIIEAIHGETTEVSIKCKEMLPNSQTRDIIKGDLK